MLKTVRVGVIDGGFATPAGHGARVAAMILEACPGAQPLTAEVLRPGPGGLSAGAEAVARALEWLCGQGAALVNMSFGLRADRLLLRNACRAARAGGVVLVAATPARGPAVYPSAYDGVLKVTGDARCGPGVLSWLEDRPAGPLVGACPRPGGHEAGFPGGGGASFAAARVSGCVAAYLAGGGDPAGAGDWLRSGAAFTGRERRR